MKTRQHTTTGIEGVVVVASISLHLGRFHSMEKAEKKFCGIVMTNVWIIIYGSPISIIERLSY